LPGLQVQNKRPLPVTIVSCLYAATGVIGLAFHLAQFKPQQPFQSDIIWISLVSLIAIVCSVAMFRGSNWGRWLAMAWIGFHVILSFFHSWRQVAVHALFFLLFAYALFRPEASAFFQPGAPRENAESA
jgi:hypothetical protein